MDRACDCCGEQITQLFDYNGKMLCNLCYEIAIEEDNTWCDECQEYHAKDRQHTDSRLVDI